MSGLIMSGPWLNTVFQENRRTMFGIAYRMLGSVADAEDVVQDAWLRWHQVTEQAAVEVANPPAYLARTVTNLSLDRLRSAAAQRESYVGTWLPEPLVTAAADVEQPVEQAESISLAMLVVLETLSPLERAVFVLREVFGFGYPEVAAMLDRSETSVRQVGSRARAHVQARRPRYDASQADRRRVTEMFLAACLGGDLNRMMELLAPDVTAWTDGGGKVPAARRPIRGASNVARWIVGVLGRPIGEMAVHPVDVNGEWGLLITADGVPDSVAVFDVDGGRVMALRLVRNPEKLQRVRVP